MKPWKSKGAKAKKLQSLRKALRDAYALLKAPAPGILKEGVKLAMSDIQQMIEDYLELKRQRGVV